MIESVNQVRIFPVASPQQEILQHEVVITDAPELFFFLDYWGNRCADFSLPEPHKKLSIDSRLIVRTTYADEPPFVNTYLSDLHTMIEKDFQLLDLSKPEEIKSTAAIDEILASIKTENKTVMHLVQDCSSFIFHQFNYDKGITTIETTIDEILEHRSGVCQDFAHVLL